MPLELAFSTAQIVIIAAIAFLSMLIGALFNQRKTRIKWEYVRNQLLDEMEQTKLELNTEILELKETIHQKELVIDQYQDKLEFRLEQLGKAQAQAERTQELEQSLVDNQRKQMETQLALSKSNAMQQTLAASFDAKQQALNDKIQLLEDSEVRLTAQFENLATKIFEAR
ncbi:DNA recombination protein RmuC, partial [Shewanella sp. 0m-11]